MDLDTLTQIMNEFVEEVLNYEQFREELMEIVSEHKMKSVMVENGVFCVERKVERFDFKKNEIVLYLDDKKKCISRMSLYNFSVDEVIKRQIPEIKYGLKYSVILNDNSTLAMWFSN